MKTFVKKIAIITIIVSILTAGVNALYISNSPNCGTMGEKKDDEAYIVDVPEHIQLCNFGNSHGYYGFDYSGYAVERACYNFSLPAQSMSYNYRILENYRENIALGAVVLICISPQTFFEPPETESDDFESMNKRYYHFLDKEYIKEYDLKTDLFVSYLPVLSVSLADVVNAFLHDNPDYWNNTTNPEKAFAHGLSRYSPALDGDGKLTINEEELDAAYHMVELCREIGALPIFVTVPYLSAYTDAIQDKYAPFFDELFALMDQLCKDTQTEYHCYAFDERFSSNYDYFFNSDHLNRMGATAFTKILMEEVVNAQ